MNRPTRSQVRPGLFLAPLVAGCTLLLILQNHLPAASDLTEPESVAGLSVRKEGGNAVLAWPSHPRESFVVLWRPDVSVEARWIALTSQLRALPLTNQTPFHDQSAFSRGPAMLTNAILADFYRVFLIPDFWFEMDGVELHGGPHCGGDFLPMYNGSTETWDFFKPRPTLVVDGELSSDMKPFGAGEDIEHINFGTHKKPHWAYSLGLWFQHETLPNGEHTLQLSALLTLNNIVGDASQYLTLTNRPIRVRVNNEISYPDWQPFIQAGTYTFVARSATRRVNWRIAVYGERGKLLTSKTGRTTDGEIRWTWDLRDKRGRFHDNFDADQGFKSTLTTWPMSEQIKGAQALLAMRGERFRRGWWTDRLGRDFVRSPPSEEERRRRFILMEPHPLESRSVTRPLEQCLNPPDCNVTRRVEVGALLAEVHLDDLLGVVPRTASIGHEDGLEQPEERDADEVADEEAARHDLVAQHATFASRIVACR